MLSAVISLSEYTTVEVALSLYSHENLKPITEWYASQAKEQLPDKTEERATCGVKR